jgi:hypothetical protein
MTLLPVARSDSAETDEQTVAGRRRQQRRVAVPSAQPQCLDAWWLLRKGPTTESDSLAAGDGPSEILSGQMSQQNVAVARRWVELFNERGDVDEFLSLHDPDVELQTPGGPRLRGHDQVRDSFEAGYENVQPRIIPERFAAEGDIVVGLGRTEVRWIESGEVGHEGESAGGLLVSRRQDHRVAAV